LTPELQLRGDGIYLVTGGLGGLGLALARWLSDRGAGHVVLVGRSAPSAQAIEGMQAIMQAGSCLVSTAQCDIGDSTAVVELIAGLKACDGRRLRGVFHLAGVLDDGMLREQTMERFERVLSPKAVGGWNLHIHTLGLPLDYFVLFSSAAALLGSPGQANYAAANAYLDSLAHYRRAQGLPALSINWGSWAEAGMAARLKESEGERWAAIGNGWIDIPHGLRTLEWLMLRNCVQCGVLPIEWPKFVRALPAGMEPAWLSEILDEVAATNPVERPRPVLREELLTCDVSTRDEVALGHLTRMAMTVLSWDLPQDPDPDRIFSELGFDSLTGVEFCNAIGRSLDCHVPPTVLFDYSTLNRLTDYVVNELFATATAGQRSMASPVRPLAPPSQDNGDGSTLDEEERSQLADEVEGMSEEEMNAMIESQLQVLKRN
jgi:NAD(P)-dependent dehydrogenase (short-subunit alcohol dehydrogenase family)/acyl carrier protein